MWNFCDVTCRWFTTAQLRKENEGHNSARAGFFEKVHTNDGDAISCYSELKTPCIIEATTIPIDILNIMNSKSFKQLKAML